MFGRFILIGALVIAFPTTAAEREPEQLPLTGKWVVNFDRDSCQLQGEFGNGDGLVTARFTRYQPSDSFDLVLIGNRLRTNGVTAKIAVDFGLAEAPAIETAMVGMMGGSPAMFLTSVRVDGRTLHGAGEEYPDITPQQEKSVSGVTAATLGRRPFRLVFGSLDKPMAIMRKCMTDLVQSWGYDPEAQAHLGRPLKPATPPQTWVKQNDYPRSALQGRHSGLVQFRLDVDAAGKVFDCHILARTSPDDFADRTCRIMRERATFTPALDAQGNPVRSFFVSKMTWLMNS
jgi:hypothetical protein